MTSTNSKTLMLIKSIGFFSICQPFTDPTVSPRRKNFCPDKNTTNTGIVAIQQAAMVRPYCLPVSPTKAFKAKGNVHCLQFEIKISGSM